MKKLRSFASILSVLTIVFFALSACDLGNSPFDAATLAQSGDTQVRAAFTGFIHVKPSGNDSNNGSTEALAVKTLARAADLASSGNTIKLAAGTYSETKPAKVKLGVSIEGAGQTQTIIQSSGVQLDPWVTGAEGDYHLWPDGSLIQLISYAYPQTSQASPIYYGSLTEMLPAANGDQVLKGFTIDGQNSLKAGVWVYNRSNVTMENVTIKDTNGRGAVFGKSDMWWYEPMPAGKWMQNITVRNNIFTNNGKDTGGESWGNLHLAGIDGAQIYNNTINENEGYGIKFIYVGHFKNVKIFNNYIRVPETDSSWGEDISIELWNLEYGNEVYNNDVNTWFSFVNHNQITSYEPVGSDSNNLKVYSNKLVDLDGNSSKEAIEAALSGVQIFDNYIQDKGFGIAIWNGLGGTLKKNYIIRNNIFTNINRQPGFGFGKSSAVFIPDSATNIKIWNNVFENQGNSLNLDAGTSIDVRNNVFLNSLGADIEGGSGITFTNNLKYHTNPQKAAWVISGTVGANNYTNTLPGFNNSGDRAGNWYKPASSSSFVVNKGFNVGLPIVGSAADIGYFEFGWSPGPTTTSTTSTLNPNAPTTTSTSSTSSTTTTTVGWTKLEAEGGVLAGGAAIGSLYSGASAGGYVENFYPGASARLSVNVSTAGDRNVRVRFASGGGAKVAIYVNNVYVKFLQFASSGSWSTWSTLTNSVYLNNGANTITFKNDYTNNDLINFDYLEVYDTSTPSGTTTTIGAGTTTSTVVSATTTSTVQSTTSTSTSSSTSTTVNANLGYYQAEAATINGGFSVQTRFTDQTYTTTFQYVSEIQGNGNGVTWNNISSSGGSKQVTLRYSSRPDLVSAKSAGRGVEVYVNNVLQNVGAANLIQFSNTALDYGNVFATISFNVNFNNSASNKLELRAKNTSWSEFISIDWIGVSGTGGSATTTTVASTTSTVASTTSTVASTSTTVPNSQLANGTYQFGNVASGKAQQAESWQGGVTSNANYNGANSQKWTVTAVGSYYKIINVGNGYALSSESESVKNQSYTGADTQLWSITPLGAGQYKVINKANGLAAKAQDVWIGNPIVLAAYGSNNLFKWTFGAL